MTAYLRHWRGRRRDAAGEEGDEQMPEWTGTRRCQRGRLQVDAGEDGYELLPERRRTTCRRRPRSGRRGIFWGLYGRR